MLYVSIKIIELEYNILDTVKLFYNDSDIIHPDSLSGQMSPLLTVDTLNKNGEAFINISFTDRTGSRAVEIPAKNESLSPLAERRRIKWAVKTTVYDFLSGFTGRFMPWGVLTGIRPSKIVHELLDENVPGDEIIARLTGYYRVSPGKASLLYSTSIVEKDILNKTPINSIGLYIGIPFCPTRCLYCSFTSNPADRYSRLMKPYINALRKELEAAGTLLQEKNLTVQSVYFGGGTPTALPDDLFQELLEYLPGSVELKGLQEYTVEAGRPDSVTEAKLEIMKRANVGRISINPQTMNEGTLKAIGRRHTPGETVNAFNLARSFGFSNINMDVIVGLPDENLAMFENTMEEIQKLRPESLTVHTLAVKRASRLKEELDNYELDSNDTEEMVESGRKYAEKMGMHPYYLYRQKNILGNLENIGYCKPGTECIYNIQIMEERQTIVALGAGSVTKVFFPDENRVERAFNVKSVEEYIGRIDEMIDRKKKLLLD